MHPPVELPKKVVISVRHIAR